MDRWSTPEQLRDEANELRDKRARLKRDAEEIHRNAGDRALNAGEEERFSNLTRGIDGVDAALTLVEEAIAERTERLAHIQRMASNPRNVEPGDGSMVFDEQAGQWVYPDRSGGDSGPFGAVRDRALRTIERHKGALTPQAGDRLERIVRSPRFDFEARYIAAVGDPAYHEAFGKLVADPMQGHLRFTPAEVAAVQKVSALETERALSTGTGSAGGFAIPFTLDPSVLLSSNGALNPIRDLSRVFTIATKEWKGVSSTGVTAAYVAESTEATDASPTLVQPTITTAQGRAFIPFSIELGQDWGSLQEELLRLIADGRDVLDSAKFLSGTGTNEPVGLLAIGSTGSLTTTQRVQTDVAATLDIDDVWDVKGNITNTRFAASATFVANSAMFDRIYRFTPSGSTTEPQAMPTREGPLCGLPKRDWSDMVNTTTTGSKVLLVGDFSNYFIADRIGMTAELIPHLFGATNRFPTGQRGIYAFWRTGAVVAVPNAFRYLEVL